MLIRDRRILYRLAGAILLLFLLGQRTGIAEHNVLTIAVTNQEDARNCPVEEAFFSQHPEVTIEYVLYTEDQLYSRLLTQTLNADCVILPYGNLVSMEEKGHLVYLDEATILDSYPDTMLDLSNLLTRNGQLFALPVRLYQEYWYWNEGAGKALGLSYPGAGAWSWEDFHKLEEQFPVDVDQDGSPDIYLLYGEYLPAYPALRNVDLEMFFQYVSSNNEFETFTKEYLSLFKQVLQNKSLLDFTDPESTGKTVLLGRASLESPIDYMIPQISYGNGYSLFIPPPTLSGENGPYPGYLWGCAILKTASEPELAADFIRAMVSEEALDYVIQFDYNRLVSSAAPAFEYIAVGDATIPSFVEEKGRSVARVHSGRELEVTDFPYSEEVFQQAQDFRSRLTVNAAPFSLDFYNAAYDCLQEWIAGRMTDSELTTRLNTLLELAGGHP